MKTWDILLSTVPTSYNGSLDALGDKLFDCLDALPEVTDQIVSGDLDTGQMDAHFEYVGSDDPVVALNEAIDLLRRALGRCGASADRGTALVEEIHAPVVGFQVSSVPAALPTDHGAQQLMHA